MRQLNMLLTSKNTPPRVLFVEGSTGFGGSGSILDYLLQQFDQKLFSPCVCTYFPTNSAHVQTIRALGIPYFTVSKRRPFEPWAAPIVTRRRNRWLRKAALLASWTYYWVRVQGSLVSQLVSLLRRARISVVVFNNDLHMHSAGILAAKIARKRIIVRKAGGVGEGRMLKRILTRCVDLFIVVSDATRNDQLQNPKTKRMVLVAEAVDLARFTVIKNRSEARRDLGLPVDQIIVGSASRLAEGKGQKELVLAAASVLAKRPGVLFYIAGGEDPFEVQQNLLGKLKTLARELGVSDRVIFPGWRDDIENVLAAIDVFVHCPTTFIEGFCIANLEAMASGIPTVVSRNGGLPDAVLDGVTGRIVEPGDIDGLAEAILDVIDHPEKARQMGRNARQRVADYFEIKKMARTYEKLIGEYCPRT
jgi:glycosyltransferase involved in cell wall biosynthesis